MFCSRGKVYPLVFLLFMSTFSTLLINVNGRKALTPVEDIEDVVNKLNRFNLGDDIDTEGPACLLDVEKDFPRPNKLQPLYIIPNTSQYWLPNGQGQVVIPRGAHIELHCIKSFANSTEPSKDNATTTFGNILKFARNTRTLFPRCLHDKYFLWQGNKYEFRQFICTQPARYKVEQLDEKCPAMADERASITSEMYRVGYNVSNGDEAGRFVETMRICHDDSQLRTLYVHHKLVPASIHFQKFVKRLNFSKAGYFKDYNMQHIYSQFNQQKQASVLLKGEHGHLFDNNTLFLARGHLAAKADFIYATQQRATFTFFNVAPQWQAFNGGQWAALEDEVRKFVANAKLQVDCYTGTWGIMQLPHNSSDTQPNTEFFLTQDDNNNGVLPVPKIYYRILVEYDSGRGIALVGVNNPFVGLKEIDNSYVICNDIHEQIAWLKWMQNKNLKKGYLYACQVAEFVKHIGHLPRELLNVKDILE